MHVVINCAASVNFDDPLHDALEINYFGCMKMMSLAKECKKILSFCHVSTTYVNSNMGMDGDIKEEIYNQDQKIDQIVSELIQMNPHEAQKNLVKIMNGYPNTYTFTKAFSERSIK